MPRSGSTAETRSIYSQRINIHKECIQSLSKDTVSIANTKGLMLLSE